MRDNPFGVLEFLNWDHPWNNRQYSTRGKLRKSAAMMKEAGAGMVRMDFLWQDIEPQPGKFDFARYDVIVDILMRNGIGILGILDYSTDWDSPSGEWNAPSHDLSRFLAYAKAVALRYKGGVSHWEVWNEPDSPVYWKDQDGLKSYCLLLRQAYPALKGVDPRNLVLNGGLTHSLDSVNRLYDNGGRGYFDALNIHMFANPSSGALAEMKTYVEACAKVMERHGDGGKKIWVTETGCPGVGPGRRIKPWWMGRNPSEKKQAAWVKQVLGGLLAEPRVEKIFWAFFRDTRGHWKDGVDYFGLVRNDFSAKPAYRAYREAAHEHIIKE